MDLTDKISHKQITKDNWSDAPTKHIYEYGVYHTLNHVTPKVAIDFAEWIRTNSQVELLKHFVHEPFTLNNKEKNIRRIIRHIFRTVQF